MNSLIITQAAQQQAGTPSSVSHPKQHKFTILTGRPPISTRMLFHIHADEFGSHSKLEGEHCFNAVRYLSDFLRDRQKKGLSLYRLDPSILEELGGTIHLEVNGQTDCMRQIRHACQAKKPFLIGGGWTGKPGHAIYYEYDPDKETFRLYNLGGGVENHLQVCVGRKEKRKPYCEWRGVSQDQLLDPDFLSCLWELERYNEIPGQRRPTHYQANDLYSSLRKWLGVSEEEGVDENHLWKGAGRTGICAWDSLLAFIYTKINDPEEYKRFLDDIKMQSLIESIRVSFDDLGEEDMMHWNLIRKSIGNFSRSLAKRADLIDVAQTATLLSPVKKWIRVHQLGWKWINPSSKPREEPALSKKVALPPPFAL